MPSVEDKLTPMLDVSCHLLSRSFNRDLIAVMRRAKESGVVGCILHCDWTRITELTSLVKQWPGQMFATVGISPDIIKKNNDKVRTLVNIFSNALVQQIAFNRSRSVLISYSIYLLLSGVLRSYGSTTRSRSAA